VWDQPASCTSPIQATSQLSSASSPVSFHFQDRIHLDATDSPPSHTTVERTAQLTAKMPKCKSSYPLKRRIFASNRHGPVFCDYCDVYLTHDSMSVRKAHNSGRNHLRNVVDYYQRMSLFCPMSDTRHIPHPN
jgi:hypothetical protein